MSDPAHTPQSGDIRPLVAAVSGNRGVWILGAGLVVAGALLFQTLEARRTALVQPTVTQPSNETRDSISSPPDLEIPPAPTTVPDPNYERWQNPAQRLIPQAPRVAPTIERTVQPSAPPTRSLPAQITGSETTPGFGAPSGLQAPTPRASEAPNLNAPSLDGENLVLGADARERVKAGRFKNPGTTVPKGVVIQAVLETALDSNRPGFARAIVSRDIYAFDGSRILIPRGSRLIGEYKADLTLGQKRVLVQWQRLMRPDGVTVNLDSPAADPLGRAGVGGKVNSHFFERFAGSILQSTLDIGAQFANQRLSRNTYVVALPTTTQGLVTNQGEKIPPTVTVRQGSSVSVFVARDLDFTDTDR